MIRVGIVDDQEIFRQGLKMLLSLEEDIRVVGEGANGHQGYNLCKQHQLDVLLMDIKMPKMDGVEATRRIIRDFPPVKVIILTTFEDEEYIFEALRQGAYGYLLKDSPPAKIAEAVREVYRGGALIQPAVAARVVEKMRRLEPAHGAQNHLIAALTEREKEIMRLVGMGKSNREIAGELYITEGTVKNHLGNLLMKLRLRDRTQLAIFTIKNNLL